jgi:hypothetical protein
MLIYIAGLENSVEKFQVIFQVINSIIVPPTMVKSRLILAALVEGKVEIFNRSYSKYFMPITISPVLLKPVIIIGNWYSAYFRDYILKRISKFVIIRLVSICMDTVIFSRSLTEGLEDKCSSLVISVIFRVWQSASVGKCVVVDRFAHR